MTTHQCDMFVLRVEQKPHVQPIRALLEAWVSPIRLPPITRNLDVLLEEWIMDIQYINKKCSPLQALGHQ